MTTAGSLLIGLPAGAWVDRWRKRPVLVSTDLLRAALLMTVPLAWWADVLTIWLLYAIALGHGLLTVLFEVGYTSYIPALVGRDHLVEANSRIAAVRSAVSISGPGLAGPLVGWLGAPLTLIVSAAGMLLSALGVQQIRAVEAVRPAASRRHLTREVSEGLRFVLGHRLLRPMLITDGVFSLSLVVYQTMLLIFLARQLELSTFGIGLVLSVMASGGFVGALLAGRLIAQAGLQQRVTPDRLLGRMSATVRFVQWGSMPVAALLGGALGGLFGPSAVLWAGAAGMTAAFLPALLSPLRATYRLPASESTAAQ